MILAFRSSVEPHLALIRSIFSSSSAKFFSRTPASVDRFGKKKIQENQQQ